MIVTKEVSRTREIIAREKSRGKRIGLVPTMGALHEGHMALVNALKPHCDLLAMWTFVNPTQFNNLEDYRRYPRDLERDCEIAAAAGVELLFAPDEKEIYPRGIDAYQRGEMCRVHAGDRSRRFEGMFRPGHFDGVVHVVSVIFNIMTPDVAAFGEKDFQQLQVIRQMVEDLHMPVEILPVKIIREQSGLALSSRNQLLGDKAGAAQAISQALFHAVDEFKRGERASSALAAVVEREIAAASLEVEYVAIVDRRTLEPVDAVSDPVQILVAAYAGSVRLIDNMELAEA